MTTLLNIWYPRNLTLYGRITILKTLALSKLIYNTSMLSFPSSFINTVNQAIKSFICGKTAKIKHTTMIGPKEKGVLNMPDFVIINDALKVAWVKRLNDSCDASWSTIPLSFLSNVGGRSLFQCNFDLRHLRVHIAIAFYKGALNAWQKLIVSSPETKERILDEALCIYVTIGSLELMGSQSITNSGMKRALSRSVILSAVTPFCPLMSLYLNFE